MISLWLTVVAVVGNAVNSVAVLVSIVTEFRVWPPGERDWRYWLTWVCWYPATFSLVLVGVFDWGSLGVVPVWGQIAGAVVPVSGLAVTFAAIFDLGVSTSTGLEGDLQTTGLYRYSRNPQYVGDIASATGWVVLTDSKLVLVIAATASLYYLFLPFAEEPWLRAQYAEEYEAYCRVVPRFVGVRTVKIALRQIA